MKLPKQLKAVAENTLNGACLQGSNGAVYEAGMYFHEFGFELQSVPQPVPFWWGSEEGEGHLSLYVNHFEEVLQTITAT